MYKQLSSMRSEQVIMSGQVQLMSTDPAIAYSRYNSTYMVVVVFNVDTEDTTVDLTELVAQVENVQATILIRSCSYECFIPEII